MSRHTNIPASYLVLIDSGKTLLLKRHNTGYHDGEYSLIAGHVESGETYTDCIRREAREEAGILLPDELQVKHVMHRKSDDSERTDVFFVTDNWQGEIKNMEPHKCAQLAWFEQYSLPKNTIPYVRHALSAIQNNNFYSEFDWENF